MYILNSYPVKTDDFRRTQPHRSQTRELRHHYAQVRYEREGGVWRLKAIENLTFRYTVGLAA